MVEDWSCRHGHETLLAASVPVDAKVLLYWPGEARPFGSSSAYVHFLDVTFIERESESGTSYFSSCCHVIISKHFVYDKTLSLSLSYQTSKKPSKYELLAHLLWKRELEMRCFGLHWALSLSLSLSLSLVCGVICMSLISKFTRFRWVWIGNSFGKCS